MSWIALGVAAQVLAAGAVLIDKGVISRHQPHPLTLLSVVGLSNLALGLTLLAINGWPKLGVGITITAFGSGVCLAAYLIPYFMALQEADASAVGTLFQLTPLWTLLFATVFLAERPKTLQYIGFATVLAGALSIERAAGAHRPHVRVIGLMAGASLVAALGSVMAKHAYTGASFWNVTLLAAMGTFVCAAVALLVSQRRVTVLRQLCTLPGSILAAIALAEALDLGFEILYLAAVSRGPVVLVSVIAGVQPAVLVIGGALLSVWIPKIFSERTDRRTLSKRMAGAVVVVAGLGMLR